MAAVVVSFDKCSGKLRGGYVRYRNADVARTLLGEDLTESVVSGSGQLGEVVESLGLPKEVESRLTRSLHLAEK